MGKKRKKPGIFPLNSLPLFLFLVRSEAKDNLLANIHNKGNELREQRRERENEGLVTLFSLPLFLFLVRSEAKDNLLAYFPHLNVLISKPARSSTRSTTVAATCSMVFGLL